MSERKINQSDVADQLGELFAATECATLVK